MNGKQIMMLAALAVGGVVAYKILTAKKAQAEPVNAAGRTKGQQEAYDTATKWAQAEAVRVNALTAEAKAREAEVAAAEKKVAQINAAAGPRGPQISLDDLGVLYNW